VVVNYRTVISFEGIIQGGSCISSVSLRVVWFNRSASQIHMLDVLRPGDGASFCFHGYLL